jgi:O-antigen/teichoic acid export membrane protein
MQLRQKAFKAVKWTASSSVISAILSVIKIAILSRILDKSDFGIVAVVYVILGFASVFKDLGLSAGILHKKHITSREYSSLY